MIGKDFHPFSNDWKKFSDHFLETKRTKRTTKIGGQNPQTITTISDNSFEKTTWTTWGNSFNVRRPTGRRPSKKRPSNRQLGGATFQSRPNGLSAGGRRKGNPRMPLRGLGWLGDGRDVYIENQENRFADRNAWRAREQRRGQTPPGPDGCSEGPAPLPGVRHLAAPWRMLGGRMPHAKSAKSAKSAGGNREKEIHKNVSNAPARPRMAGRREGCLH